MDQRKQRPLMVERLDQRGGLVELLWLPAWLFGRIARIRGWLYDRRLLRRVKVQVPVVCVGNIVAGGTGKTPLVVELARRLKLRSRRPGILSRGYGKAGAHGADSDEARLYAELLGDLPRIAMPNRIQGAQRLIEAGANVIVMDDGFQHRKLERDLDLVLIDATRPFGLSHGPRAFLPRGLLREPLQALFRADAIVMTRTDLVGPKVLDQIELELESLAPGVPRILARHAPLELRALGKRASSKIEKQPIEWLRRQQIDVVSGIGNPVAFEASLVRLGARLVEVRRFEDHHEYTGQDLEGLGESRPLITTAKDAVKLSGVLGERTSEHQIFALDIGIEIDRGSDVIDALLDALLMATATTQQNGQHG